MREILVVRLFGRVWIPLVILLVIGGGAFIVSRVHGIFGSEQRPLYTDSHVAGTNSYTPKQVVYEVFGPPGAVADISYFNADIQPQQVNAALLPWSLTLSINAPAVIANVVAQGDSPSLGCRIMVDGEVEAERVSHGVNAYTHCEVQGA